MARQDGIGKVTAAAKALLLLTVTKAARRSGSNIKHCQAVAIAAAAGRDVDGIRELVNRIEKIGRVSRAECKLNR